MSNESGEICFFRSFMNNYPKFVFYDYKTYPDMNKLGVILHKGQLYDGKKYKIFAIKKRSVYESIFRKKLLKRRSRGGKFPRYASSELIK